MKKSKILPVLLAACLLFTGCGVLENNSELKSSDSHCWIQLNIIVNGMKVNLT